MVFLSINININMAYKTMQDKTKIFAAKIYLSMLYSIKLIQMINNANKNTLTNIMKMYMMARGLSDIILL